MKKLVELSKKWFGKPNRMTEDDIKIVKATQLFDNFDKDAFDTMLKNTKRVKYKPNGLILKEEEIGDDFYIIIDGSVRVFTIQGDEKIALARLEKGSYFGEQALLGQVKKSRNASIEAITPVILAKINQKFVVPYWHIDRKSIQKFEQMGSEQAFKKLSETIIHFKIALSNLKKIKNSVIKEFTRGKLIFSIGDKPDNVYLILEGTVELIFPDAKKKSSLLIKRGHFFGETAVLTDQSRTASAIAYNDVKLLCIKGDNFKEAYQKLPDIQQLLQKQQGIYDLPIHGVMQQFMGKVHGIRMLTSLYTLEDGRNIMVNKSIEGDLFSIKEYEKEVTERVYHSNKEAQIEIGLCQDHIVEIQAHGEWANLPSACKSLIHNETIDLPKLKQFEISGSLFEPEQGSAVKESPFICDCMQVRQNTIQEVIDHGAKELDSISKMTGACTVCRKCKFKILEMLGDNSWITATLKLLTIHNDNIRSYSIIPNLSLIKQFIPGQHVVIQVKVNDLWLERPYTVSDILEDGTLCVTIKREPKGYFSNWLFEQGSNSLDVNITQPQGEFTLQEETEAPVVCFAGGIGITPFAAQTKHLHKKKRIHILYCALKKSDFVFLNEFKQITQDNPTITIDFRSNEDAGLLSESEIINLIKKFTDEEIYICGPEGFEKLVSTALDHIHFDKNKIHVEKFTHAGAPR